MALTVQPIEAGSNFRTFRERFNVIVGYLNSSLQDDKHLSDLKDIPASRATLKVYSKTESDERYLNEASNLGDLPNKEESRVNLHVWSRDQADARFFEESKLFSEIAGGSNAAKRRTAANNLDMYIKSDLYTRTMGNERYFETSNGNITASSVDSILADYKKGGTWNVENQTIMGDKWGSLVHLTPNGANKFQIYAPRYTDTKDQLTNVNVRESGLIVRTGRGGTTENWTRMLSTQMGKHMFFEKSNLFNELAGSARTANRQTAQNNLDVYNKATSDGRYFEESKNFNELAGGANASRRRSAANNLDMYLKADVYTRTAAANAFYQVNGGTAVPDTHIKQQEAGGSYEMTDTGPVGYKFGTLSSLSAGSGRFQLYAPHFENHYDGLTGVRTERAALWLRSGWNDDIKSWERVVTQSLGDGRYFQKSNKFSELAGSARTADRQAAQTNLDVYKKADVRNKTELDARFFQKTETYNRSQMDARYLNEESNLGDLTNMATARGHLDVYSKTESNNRYTEHGTEHYAGSSAKYGQLDGAPLIRTNKDYMAVQTSHSNALMIVNYQPATSGYKTPTRWFWRAGSATSWATFDMGTTNIHGTLTTTDTIQVPSGKHVKIGTDFLTTRAWTNSQYYTKTVSDGRYFRRTNLNDLFYEIKGAALSNAQRIKMLDNLGVYSKAKIDAEFNTGATTYLSKGSNLSDVPNKSQGLAALVELSGSAFTNARNAMRAGFRTDSDRKYYNGTITGAVGVASGHHQHYNILVRDGGDVTTFGGRRYVMKPDDYQDSDGRSVYYDFKHGATISSPYLGWNYVNTIAGYSDDSGGRAHQVSYGANGRMYHRYGTSDTAWSTFQTIAYLSDTVANSDKLGGKSLAWVRSWANLTGKPNFDDLYISRKDATAVTGTPTFQATTAMIIGGSAQASDADSHFYHGNYVNSTTPGWSIRHTYKGSEGGINNAYELWMTDNKADKAAQRKVWRIQHDGKLRLSQDMTGKSATFTGNIQSRGAGSRSHVFGSSDGHTESFFSGGSNKNSTIYISENDAHGIYVSYGGTSNIGHIGMRYNSVNKDYMNLHLTNGVVDFINRPTVNGVSLARVSDKVADSDRLDNLNSSQFLRSDVDTMISAGKKFSLGSTNEGMTMFTDVNTERTFGHLAGGNDWVHFLKTDANGTTPDSGIVFEWSAKNAGTNYSGWWLAMKGTGVEVNSAVGFFVHGQEIDTRYAKIGGLRTHDFAMKNGSADNLAASAKVQGATVVSTGDLTGKVIKQNGVKLDDRFVRFDYSGNSAYPRLVPAKDAWFRVGHTSGNSGGILPYANGKGDLGTNSWRFARVHSVNFYENGAPLTDKYAYKAGHGSQDFAAKDLTVQKVNATVEVKAKKVVIDTTIEIKKNSDGSIGFYL